MKTEIRLPQAGVDANVTVFDVNGRAIAATVGRIVIEPIFNQSTQQVPLLYGRSYVETVDLEAKEDAPPKEEDVQRFLVQIGGTTGKAKMSDKSQKVVPQFEAKRKKAQDGKSVAAPVDTSSETPTPDLDLATPEPKPKPKTKGKPKGKHQFGNDPELASLPTEQ